MANRIVMDVTGIKVSKPGFDVLTAGPNNLIFDMNNVFGVYYSSVVSVPNVSGTDYSFPYPVLPSIPVIMVQRVKPGFSQGIGAVFDYPEWYKNEAVKYTWNNGNVIIPGMYADGAGGNTIYRIVVFYNRGMI